MKPYVTKTFWIFLPLFFVWKPKRLCDLSSQHHTESLQEPLWKSKHNIKLVLLSPHAEKQLYHHEIWKEKTLTLTAETLKILVCLFFSFFSPESQKHSKSTVSDMCCVLMCRVRLRETKGRLLSSYHAQQLWSLKANLRWRFLLILLNLKRKYTLKKGMQVEEHRIQHSLLNFFYDPMILKKNVPFFPPEIISMPRNSSSFSKEIQNILKSNK